VPNRASIWNLALSLVAYVLFMILLLSAVGGVGTVELTIWLAFLVIGILLIVRRNRIARTGIGRPSGR
jgi:hypothetical protein